MDSIRPCLIVYELSQIVNVIKIDRKEKKPLDGAPIASCITFRYVESGYLLAFCRQSSSASDRLRIFTDFVIKIDWRWKSPYGGAAYCKCYHHSIGRPRLPFNVLWTVLSMSQRLPVITVSCDQTRPEVVPSKALMNAM